MKLMDNFLIYVNEVLGAVDEYKSKMNIVLDTLKFKLRKKYKDDKHAYKIEKDVQAK